MKIDILSKYYRFSDFFVRVLSFYVLYNKKKFWILNNTYRLNLIFLIQSWWCRRWWYFLIDDGYIFQIRSMISLFIPFLELHLFLFHENCLFLMLWQLAYMNIKFHLFELTFDVGIRDIFGNIIFMNNTVSRIWIDGI